MRSIRKTHVLSIGISQNIIINIAINRFWANRPRYLTSLAMIHTDLSNRVVVITFRINSPILFSSISILQYESQALMFPSSRKWNSSRSKRRGIIASATAIKSFGTVELLEWLLMPWSEQKPSAFITDVSPQSHAPPACDKNILKSCVEWSPFLKQFRQIDIHGEIPHVRQRYATTCGIQTRPHFAWLS